MTDTAERPLSREAYEAEMASYIEQGVGRADALGNRGPLRYENGELDTSFLDAFREHGYYVFTGVITPAEISELRSDVQDFLDRAPTHKGSDVDSAGRPALGRSSPSCGVSHSPTPGAGPSCWAAVTKRR